MIVVEQLLSPINHDHRTKPGNPDNYRSERSRPGPGSEGAGIQAWRPALTSPFS